MRYLLVNHVAFFKSAKPGHVLMGDMWLEDLRAQRDAIAAVGGTLIVAVPLGDADDEPDLSESSRSGSFNLVDVRPEDHGFAYAIHPMFDEPEESPPERPANPADRAKEKLDEFRMHAELAAVFEAHRKFGAAIVPGLNPELARDVQKTMAWLEKSRAADTPLLPDSGAPDATRLLSLPRTNGPSTNDYHVHRRPGETMIVRWLADDQVGSFYERMQAHFNAALSQFREEERQSQGWKQDPDTLTYLEALDAIDVRMADRYLRDAIRTHSVFVLSTQTADEMDITHLCDYVMGVPAADVVGAVSAPPDDGPTERDRAWFFKLFSLRGMSETVERICFFTYLQKSDDSAW